MNFTRSNDGFVAVLLVALVAVTPTRAQEKPAMPEMMRQMTPPEGMRQMTPPEGMRMTPPEGMRMTPMGGMMSPKAPVVPPVAGYSEGWKVLFLHTEVSDTEIAKILTEMMGSPVLVVPSLAKAPKEMLARVYVFTNGVKGDGPLGPLGFQPDVFDNPPGHPGYSPLRKILLVTWKDEPSARTLKSADEVEEALGKNELTIEEPGVVVNMPMLTWPVGQR